MLLDAEISYLYTNDLTYLRGDFEYSNLRATVKNLNNGLIKYLFIYIARIS
jgi:hypothetical protein